MCKSSFTRAWECGDWSEKIKFLPAGHHTSCADCERFREWRRISKSDSDRLKVEEARPAHIAKVMLDRATVSRLDEIARRSLHHNYMELPNDTRHGAMTKKENAPWSSHYLNDSDTCNLTEEQMTYFEQEAPHLFVENSPAGGRN